MVEIMLVPQSPISAPVYLGERMTLLTGTEALSHGPALVLEAGPKAASMSVPLAELTSWLRCWAGPYSVDLATGQWQVLASPSCLEERGTQLSRAVGRV